MKDIHGREMNNAKRRRGDARWKDCPSERMPPIFKSSGSRPCDGCKRTISANKDKCRSCA